MAGADGVTRIALGPGDPVPDLTAKTTHGEQFTLGTELSSGPVLLVFYPFAFTGICSGELHALRDRHADIAAAGVRLVAVSTDTMFALRVFAEQEGLPFDLLSDFWPHGEIAQAYGVFDADAGCALRGSFLVDTDGTLAWSVVNGIGDARDVDAHLAAIAELGSGR